MMTQQHYDRHAVARMRNAIISKHRPGRVNPHPIKGKLRLIDLINKHHVTTIHLAHAARLRVSTVRAMVLQGKAVQPVVAMQVLHGLWKLTGRQYMLVDLDMPVLPYNETTV